MAYISSCIYCKRNNVNTPWCSECRTAFCEGILGRIHKLLKQKKVKGLSRDLVRIILTENFDNLENLECRRREATTRATKKQLHDLARLQVSQELLNKWDRENPDPDPLTFA